MKKALITGVTGMVGSHLVDFLLKNTQWKIYGACRWRSPTENILHLAEQINKKKRLELKYLDLSDYNSIENTISETKPDYIFHLAAQSFPKASFDLREVTYDTNILGTDRLLYAVHKLKLNPIIHVCSSSEVFGRVPEEKLPINELKAKAIEVASNDEYPSLIFPDVEINVDEDIIVLSKIKLDLKNIEVDNIIKK